MKTLISAALIACAVPLTRLFYRDPSEPVYMMTVWGLRILPLCRPRTATLRERRTTVLQRTPGRQIPQGRDRLLTLPVRVQTLRVPGQVRVRTLQATEPGLRQTAERVRLRMRGLLQTAPGLRTERVSMRLLQHLRGSISL